MILSAPLPPLPPSHDDAQSFYAEMDAILDGPLEVPEVCSNDDEETQLHAALFDKMQRYFAFLEGGYDQYLDQEATIEYCVSRLLAAQWFKEHRQGVETCMLDLSGRAKSLPALLISYDVLLAYGAETPHIYLSLHNGIDGSAKDKIARLVHQIWAGHYAAVAEATLGRIGKGRDGGLDEEQPGWGGAQFPAEAETSQGNPIASVLSPRQSLPETSNAARLRLHQIRLRERAIQLLYEVCRVQRLDPVDMRAVDEHFVSHLFDLVEETRHHEDEAFNYQLIKVIAALNEQFMVSSLSSRSASKNVVMGILRSRLHVTKTFGENLIFMLNRASSHSAEDLCMQLLVLKLLYLLFTTQETAHYFYTNDLKVLVDVFIRELSDLPEDSESLRHTYLRVLHPLLTSTQLSTHPYKRPQIRRLLKALVTDSLYRGEVSATTRRLVQRCLEGEWCKELDRLDPDYVAPAASSSAAEAATAEPTQTSSIRTIRPSTGPEQQPSPLLSPSHKAARMRGASVSSSNTPPSYLDAPRFRSASSTMMSAQSAPTTPPPLPESAFPTAAPAVEVEDEAAMALADGRTTHDNEGDESWQHEYAREAHLEADDGGGDGVDVEVKLQPQGTQSALLSPPLPHHRPVARRASHNEFKRPTVKPANIRRAPPPAPTNSHGSTTSGSGLREGLPRTSSTDGGTFAFLQNGDGLPSLHVQAPSSGNGDDQDDDVEGERSADDEMSRSLGSIGMGGGGGDETLSRSSSPLRPSSASSAASKQRRRPPPAPPSLVATAVANSVSLDEPIKKTLRSRKSSLQESSDAARERQGRREMMGSASHPGWGSEVRGQEAGEEEEDEYSGGREGERERSETPPSSAMSATSASGSGSGTRRRPPPPPVNRSTKAR